MTEKITVLDNVDGKFGAQIKDAKGFLSFGKFYSGDKTFPVGTILDVELFTTEKGNRYINKVVGTESPKVPLHRSKNPPVETSARSSFVERDFDKENRGKTRCALLAGLYANPTVDLKNKKALEELLEWGVNKVFGE